MSTINYLPAGKAGQLSINIRNPAIEKRKQQIIPIHALLSLTVILCIPSIIVISANYMYGIIITSIIAILFFVIPLTLHKKNKLYKWNTVIRYIEACIMAIIGVVLLLYTQWFNGISGTIWSIILTYLATIERSIFKPQQIFIHKLGITYSYVIKPITILWNTIENIVIRSDYISIFKKNNRYIQFEITDDLSDAELKEINELCEKLVNSQ